MKHHTFLLEASTSGWRCWCIHWYLSRPTSIAIPNTNSKKSNQSGFLPTCSVLTISVHGASQVSFKSIRTVFVVQQKLPEVFLAIRCWLNSVMAQNMLSVPSHMMWCWCRELRCNTDFCRFTASETSAITSSLRFQTEGGPDIHKQTCTQPAGISHTPLHCN